MSLELLLLYWAESLLPLMLHLLLLYWAESLLPLMLHLLLLYLLLHNLIHKSVYLLE
jgi:hypothetical protein